MAWCLTGTKPLPKPLIACQLDPQEQTLFTIKMPTFSSKKMKLTAKCGPFRSGLSEAVFSRCSVIIANEGWLTAKLMLGWVRKLCLVKVHVNLLLVKVHVRFTPVQSIIIAYVIHWTSTLWTDCCQEPFRLLVDRCICNPGKLPELIFISFTTSWWM